MSFNSISMPSIGGDGEGLGEEDSDAEILSLGEPDSEDDGL